MELKYKQTLALDILENKNGITELLFGGAAGSGKSYLGCYWSLKTCMKYGNTRMLIGRKVLDELLKSTFVTFKKVCKEQGVVEGVHYKHNYQRNETTFYNGSVILWMHLGYKPTDPDYQRFGSLELTGAFLEEAGELVKKCVQIISSRIRHNLVYGEPKLFMGCNPSKNFLYRDYFLAKKNGTIEEYREFIQALTLDNYSPDDPYVKQLKKLDKIDRDRLLYGNWDYESNEDCIFQPLNIIHDLFTNSAPIDKEFFISCDVAGSGADRAVIVLWQGYQAKEFHISRKCTQGQLRDQIQLLKDRYSVRNTNIVIDADGIGLGIAELAFDGCKKFNNGSAPIITRDSRPSDKKDVGQKDFSLSFANLKTQCYYKMRDIAKDGKIQIKLDNIVEFGDNIEGIGSSQLKDYIIEELDYVRRIDIDKDTKIRLLQKDKIKEELGRSPDFSDALMMRFYYDLKSKNSLFEYLRKN
jgi:phage terminase large subunit